MGQAFQLQILQNPKQTAIISDAWFSISLTVSTSVNTSNVFACHDQGLYRYLINYISDSKDTTLTYEEFGARVTALAAALKTKLPKTPGEPIIIGLLLARSVDLAVVPSSVKPSASESIKPGNRKLFDCLTV